MSGIVAINNNNTIGRLPYSLKAAASNPSEKNSEKKVYAVAQRRQTIGMAALAKHIHEHNSNYSAGTIAGVITDLVECMKEVLLAGNFVKLDGFATIGYTYSSEGVDDANSFNPSTHIKAVNLRADYDGEFEVAMNTNAQFEYVGSREQQAKAKKEEKEAVNTEIGTEGSDTGGGDDQTE